MSLGKNLKSLRLAKGLDQKDLERLSGVAFGTISAIEVRNSKRSEHAPALAQALGVPMEALLSDDAHQWLEENKKVEKPTTTLQNTVNLSSSALVVVPHLKKEEAGMYEDFLNGSKSPQSDPEIWAAPASLQGIEAFSVTIEDDVMEPLLPIGSRAIIGVGVPHRSGDRVFVRTGSTWMIRRLIIDGDTLYLDAPRTQSKPMAGEIVGPVISVNMPTMDIVERMKTR